ncbi:hypothetical protein DCC81_01015 [Chitinophaga parva]|uniref:Cytochrome B n=1 Tax=Chitinophaga parva TaxID=2169414 RepID=A0A2T7BK86_9BACT|nr:hypothetical protein [Chitinophaga parva]PUZ28094.1 hypothetical protein DCC81_01015 [Chitinophaga parva]
MYVFLLFLHNALRWLVLASLVTVCWRGFRGWWGRRSFTALDERIRHITATIAHCQLAIGYILYFNSPVVAYFRAHANEALPSFAFRFFGIIHIALMTLAVIVITIGASIAKRRQEDAARFRIMAICCTLALLIIFCAIPWPFSPLAQRPYFRNF